MNYSNLSFKELQSIAIDALTEINQRTLDSESSLNRITHFDPTISLEDHDETTQSEIKEALAEDQLADATYVSIEETISLLK